MQALYDAVDTAWANWQAKPCYETRRALQMAKHRLALALAA